MDQDAHTDTRAEEPTVQLGLATDSRVQPQPSPRRGARRWRRRILIALALVVALLVGLGILQRTGHLPTPEPRPAPLPEQVVGGYWMKWDESNSVRLADVDPRYNVIYLAFAQGREGTGALHFNQSAQPDEQFAEDLKTVRARGQRLILSIGGEAGYIDMSTPERRQEMVDSLIRIHREEVPYDGIDWDVETQTLDVENTYQVTRAVKDHLGDNLAVTLAPPGSSRDDYKELARRLGDDLSYIGIQYYEYPTDSQQERIGGARHHTEELIEKYGIPAERIVIGMMVIDEDNDGQYVPDGPSRFWTVQSSQEGWQYLRESFPGLRGVYLWEISGDARLGGQWIQNMAPLVTESPDEPTDG